jgi:DNA polymerase-3 subunit gamma/tau
MSSSELFPTPANPGGAAPQPRGESQSLYRKYRPQSFAESELVGQEHIVQTLKNAIVLDRVAHAYLFCGPRGTGKTTMARLLAKAVNCLDPDPNNRPCNACSACVAINTGATTDVIEIDAASNRGIDDIRDLRERIKYAPTQLATKFYIIDEAHQITGAAANAFLKTLEEPPKHTRFVLATTDPEELLQTIVSRCQRFDFRRIPLDAMMVRLQVVVEGEGLEAERPALEAIARHATGSLRDAVGLLDQLSVYQEERGDTGHRVITVDAVRALLGISRNDRIIALVNAVADRDARMALELVNDAVDSGEDARQINRQLVAYVRELLFARAGADRGHDETTKALANRFSIQELSDLAKLFSEVDFKIKRSLYGQLPLEIALVESVSRGANLARQEAPQAVRPEPQATPAAARPGPLPPAPDELLPTNRLAGRIKQAAPANRAMERPQQKPEEPLAFAPPPGITKPVQQAPDPVPVAKAQSTQPASTSTVKSGANEPLTVERLAELWTQIRLDVKSIDRRVEALLAASDPHDVVGDEVHLVTPYDFHARKLNEDGARNIVSEVVERIFGRDHIVVVTFQIGNTPPKGPDRTPFAAESSPPAPSPLSAPAREPDSSALHGQAGETPEAIDQDAILDERTRAAMAIFDAVPIEEPNGNRTS